MHIQLGDFRKQMRNIISGYVERKILIRTGTGPGTRYGNLEKLAKWQFVGGDGERNF